MKALLFGLLFLGMKPDFMVIRSEYRAALTSPKHIQNLKTSTKPHIQDALSLAYYATAVALEARESSWVPTKIKLANSAHELLNKAVNKDPNSIEIRFLRFSFQANTPSMLGLQTHITSDKSYLLSNIQTSHPLWDVMKAYYSQCSVLSSSEKQRLNRL